MNIAELIKHPEQMDKETLYDLRSLLALYPYYQSARLLLLQNLYLMHDPTFDEELRRAAVYITDRRVIFNFVEAAHYQLKGERNQKTGTEQSSEGDRTATLIDNFLDSIPPEDSEEKDRKRKPTPADASVDYVAYLLQTSDDTDSEGDESHLPAMKGQALIDNFINHDNGKIELKDEPEFVPQLEDEPQDGPNEGEEGYYTETLARIYIKQGRYERALTIIQQLNLNYPKKNAYFADQIRFLKKLIINNKKNNK
ncbi:MAG: tetratricopeptide repeat protein [Prevotella sp.]|nr:tetratricopeptide repeat protein [Prevotella sp.]MDY4039205.1 tetratricopeptide repeat protein [Prevotella sp.]